MNNCPQVISIKISNSVTISIILHSIDSSNSVNQNNVFQRLLLDDKFHLPYFRRDVLILNHFQQNMVLFLVYLFLYSCNG